MLARVDRGMGDGGGRQAVGNVNPTVDPQVKS
jgi:hypothetical protein